MESHDDDDWNILPYAEQWCSFENPEYYSYSQDCANFVSQALYAGGMPMNEEWHSYKTPNISSDNRAVSNLVLPYVPDVKNYQYDWDEGEPWRLAKKQYEYLSDPENGYINGNVIPIKDAFEIKFVAIVMGIKPGDLIYFAGKDGTNPHHAAMVSKVENGEIYYTAHTNSARVDCLSKKLGGEQVLVIRMNDFIPKK